MKRLLLLAILVLPLLGNSGRCLAQSAELAAVALRFHTPAAGQGVEIRWPKDANFVSATARRRHPKTDMRFYETDPASGGLQRYVHMLSDTSAIDTTYQAGMLVDYEVRIVSKGTNNQNYTRTGILAVCRDCPPEAGRGVLVLVVEKMVQDSLPQELAQLQQDLRADGWRVRMVPVSETDAVPAVKDSIYRIYQADTANVKMVYLLGHVPVPYSGNIVPDDHPQHEGAWSADGYYVAFDTDFTDASINNIGAERPENKNSPGDGKFDQSSLSGRAYLGICRVSMHNLPVFRLANAKYTEVFLTRRYLQKAHRYKMGRYATNHSSMIDDNFGYFGGESFATAGWMSQYACVGSARIRARPYDLLFDSKTRNWLMGYGCGGGGYEACLGVGNSRNFANDSVNIVFMQLYGSYFGDWDSQDNLMRSSLASRGGVLTNSWSGRPWHHYHLLGAGLPYGETARTNLFNSGQGIAANRSQMSVSNAFLGDPSLRMEYFQPPVRAQGRQVDNFRVEVRWVPGLDSVSGYHVYRATSLDSAMQRLTATPVQDTVYQDVVPGIGPYYYMVRGVRKQAYPGGSYVNQSLGVFTDPVSILVAGAPGQSADVSLCPNPTSGIVRIESTEGIHHIQVLDGLGRSAMMQPVSGHVAELDMSALSGGVYTLKICTDKGWRMKRLVRL